MRKLLVCALLAMPLHAAAQMPACHPQVDSSQLGAGQGRFEMLEQKGSGWIEFSTSEDVGAVYSIKRLAGPGNPQWQVSRVGPDGHNWTWNKRWGLPAMTLGDVSRDESVMVETVMGAEGHGGVQRLWDRLLANPGISNEGSEAFPEYIHDGAAVAHYEEWGRPQAHDPMLVARKVSITPKTSSAALTTRIYLHEVVIDYPGAVGPGWPIATP